MSHILVERHWDQSLSDADMHTMLGSAAACLGVHRVDWHGSRLSADGHELFCHFSAADAESVRIALNQAGSPRGSVWAGTVHDAPDIAEQDVAQANVLVSRSFDEAVAFDDLQAAELACASCLLTHRVKRVRSYLSADRRRLISLYSAPDAESVRLALHESAMPVQRVWSFRRFG